MARRWAGSLLAVYTGALIWYATVPAAELPPVWRLGDKVQHAAAFGVMQVLALWAAGLGGSAAVGGARARFAAAVCYAVGVGGLIEILQTRVPGRTAEWADFVSDVVGAAAGLVVFELLRIANRERAGRHASHQRAL